MQGRKIEQARAALRYFIESLQPGDWFNVVPFSTEARPFFPAPVAADAEGRRAAQAKVDALEARGGTNIDGALRVALAAKAPAVAPGVTTIPIVVFLTDGQPTVGTTDVDQLLAQAAQCNAQRARIFVFGVGNDVNSRLLDRIAADSRGDRDYVREHESIEVKTGALFAKLSHPVMTQVELSCDGIDAYDLLPRTTHDLFQGSRLVVAGRYRGDGARAIRLRGVVDGARVELVFEATFPKESAAHDFVPVLWAERKVAELLDALRLHGQNQELVEEVRRLGVEYGIVTPYTSHLVVEEAMRLSRARGLPAEEGRAVPFLQHDADAARVRYDLGRAGVMPLVPPPSAQPAAPGSAGTAAAEELRAALGYAEGDAGAAKQSLERLATDVVGEQAVDTSVGLRQRAARVAPAARDAAGGGGSANLLTRRIGDRTFYLAGGVWVDSGFTEAMRSSLRVVEAFSDEYFALLREQPELAPFLAFSSRIVVVTARGAIEIR
jgi:Ca-activated chloride channel family protein